MGLMPHYDPFMDDALLWAVVCVRDCKPASPTWSNPGARVFV